MLLENDYSTKYEGFDPQIARILYNVYTDAECFFEQSTDLASKIQTQYKENREDMTVE